MPRAVMLIAALVMVLGGAGIAFSEARSYLLGGHSFETKATALETGTVRAGISAGAHLAALERCYETLENIRAYLMPTDKRDKMRETCKTVAEDVLSLTPSHAFAPILLAREAYEQQDFDAMSDALIRSWNAAPHEQWIAKLRVRMGDAARKNLRQDAVYIVDEDLKLLVQTRFGIAGIAERWVNDESFRTRIEDLVETLPERDQRRFVNNIRFVLKQNGQTS